MSTYPEERVLTCHCQGLYATKWSLEMMDKIRWATVGYHFQWTKRQYVREKQGAFPPGLRTLCATLAEQVGHNFYPEGR